MKRVLVASVFAPTPRNPAWYDLQIRFLKKTLGDDFDHAVYLNRVSPELFTHSTIIDAVSTELPFDWMELDVAMAKIVSYFEDHPDYEYYLILDSDAFPFRAHWIEDLAILMEPVPSLGLPQRHIAAPVRAENLDAFPHGCALFIDGRYLREQPRGHIRLVTKPTTNFAGFTTEDLVFDGTDVIDGDGKQLWCPLIRSNTWNPHPIVAAIYGHVFYHHGAGSRSPLFRVVETGLFRHYLSEAQNIRLEERLFTMLCEDPEGLCARLAGRFEDSIAGCSAAIHGA